MATIYLASPYGFADSTRGFLGEMVARLRAAGHVVNDPWELGADLIKNMEAGGKDERRLHEMNRQLGAMNQSALDRSDVVVACLDGPDVDSGTASEVGYAFARGKQIVGYRGDFRRTGENEGAAVNLQVQYWIEKSGGRIATDIDGVLAAIQA